MNIAFIGYGSFGRAISTLLDTNDVPYEYAGRNERLSKDADVIFITVPTQTIRKALIDNRQHITKNTIIINCSKGIEESTNLLPHQIVNEVINCGDYFCLTGPSFAEELVQKMPTIVSLGYSRTTNLEMVRKLLRTSYCEIIETPDFQAAELAGAMKNVYAILCGYASGKGYRTNTSTRIVLKAQEEIVNLAMSMNFGVTNQNMPAILGDLVLTCSSKTSRNYSYGVSLAINSDTDPHEGPVTIVEGFHTCKSIEALSAHYKTKLTLALLTSKIVEGSRVSNLEFESSI